MVPVCFSLVCSSSYVSLQCVRYAAIPRLGTVSNWYWEIPFIPEISHTLLVLNVAPHHIALCLLPPSSYLTVLSSHSLSRGLFLISSQFTFLFSFSVLSYRMHPFLDHVPGEVLLSFHVVVEAKSVLSSYRNLLDYCPSRFLYLSACLSAYVCLSCQFACLWVCLCVHTWLLSHQCVFL